MPESAHSLLALEGKLLGKGILQLLLKDAHIVSRKIILIHQHMVFHILITRNGSEIEKLSLTGESQTGNQIVAAIDACKSGGRTVGIACCKIQTTIRKSILIYILIIGENINIPTGIQTGFHEQFSARLIHLVSPFTSKGIAEETVLSIIKTSQREGCLLIHLIIMRYLKIAIAATAIAQFHIRTLIVKRIARIHSDESALCILSIKSALWSTEHIHTTQLVIVEIEGRLAHHRDIIHIDAHRRTVDTTADATHIDGRRQAAAVIRHHKIRDILREFTQIMNTEFMNLKTAERTAAQSLLTEATGFLGLGNDYNLINIKYLAAISKNALSTDRITINGTGWMHTFRFSQIFIFCIYRQKICS